MFRPLKKLMHETHETQAANRNETGNFLEVTAKKAYAFISRHYKNKDKVRAHLDKYLETANGPGILIHIRGLAQNDIDKVNSKTGLSFNAKRDLTEKPRHIQEFVMEAFARKQENEKEAAAARPSMKNGA